MADTSSAKLPTRQNGNGPLAPLRHRFFALLWVATVANSFGTFIQTMAAAWLMTNLAASSTMVAFVQTASSLPVLILALFAGATADRFGRKRQMLAAQVFSFAVGAILSGLSWGGWVTPWILLTFTFLIGVSNAVYLPAFQSSMRDHLPHELVPAGVALNAIALNLARCIAPAVGGAILASGGTTMAFVANTASCLGLVALLPFWRVRSTTEAAQKEALLPSIRAGLTYVLLHPPMRATLIRCFGFAFAGSAMFAFLPLIARQILGGGIGSYSATLATYGVGAMAAAFSVSLLRRHIDFHVLAIGASCCTAVASIVIGGGAPAPLVYIALLFAGGGWVMSFTVYNVSIQLIAPSWLVGRAVATYQTAVFAGLALGSALWGLISHQIGVPRTLVIAGISLLVLLIALRGRAYMRDQGGDEMREPRPRTVVPPAFPVSPEQGPIVTEIVYHVAPTDTETFARAMQELELYRRRNGARRWTLRQDLDNPTRWVESFWAADWAEHQRRASRSTAEAEALRERALALTISGTIPEIQRWMVHRQSG